MKDSTRRTLRTLVQVMVGLAVAAPILVDQLGLDDTARWVAVVLLVSGAVTRVMQVPEVDAMLGRLGVLPGGQPDDTGRHEA